MPQDDRKYVIFIHGFLGSASGFDDLIKRFKHEGYYTVTGEFNTFDGGVSHFAEHFLPELFDKAKDAKRIDIVTHSMGALILRTYISKNKVKNLGRIVMIAPVNHGSEVADHMSKKSWWVNMFGQSGLDLRTTVKFPNLPKNTEFGIIGGYASFNYLSRDWITGEDDGWVGLESTKLEGMKDFVKVESSHGNLTANESVINQTVYFLQNGHFASNIEMKGTPINLNTLDEWMSATDQYANNIRDWYKEFTEDGDEATLEKARQIMPRKLKEYQDRLSKRFGDFKA